MNQITKKISTAALPFSDPHASTKGLAAARGPDQPDPVSVTGALSGERAFLAVFSAAHRKRSNAVMREKLQALGRIGERTSIIRESLLGVDRAAGFALEAAKDWFDAETTRRLKAVREDLGSLALFEEHLLGKVQFLLDAVLGFISIEQNDIFKVLTVASVVGIFPTLVAGWYGMNFVGMPELHWAWGYPFGIGMIVLSTIVPLLWFKWRGWL